MCRASTQTTKTLSLKTKIINSPTIFIRKIRNINIASMFITSFLVENKEQEKLGDKKRTQKNEVFDKADPPTAIY